MIFEGFKLHATPTVHEAYCTNKKCKKKPALTEVSNGMFSIAFFCRECESVYLLQLNRLPKVPKEFKQHCLDSIEADIAGRQARGEVWDKVEERKNAEREARLAEPSKKKKK